MYGHPHFSLAIDPVDISFCVRILGHGFIMVLHNFTEASGNRLSLVPSASVLFHSDPIAQFCSHPEKYIIVRPGTGALFVIVVLHNSSEVSENRLPLAL